MMGGCGPPTKLTLPRFVRTPLGRPVGVMLPLPSGSTPLELLIPCLAAHRNRELATIERVEIQ
jgi:hypothetical protein